MTRPSRGESTISFRLPENTGSSAACSRRIRHRLHTDGIDGWGRGGVLRSRIGRDLTADLGKRVRSSVLFLCGHRSRMLFS